MDYAIAVLDIGKTNKKVALFDDALNTLAIRREHIDTVNVEGLDVEPVEEIEEWCLTQLTELAGRYPIRAISISTHGASVVCVGEDGKPSIPSVAYTNEIPDEVHERFYAEMGSRAELQKTTATAEVNPLINVGKLLYYSFERFPEGRERTKHVLLYPQYFAYRLTGEATADFTYTGCHSYLWDFTRWDWSIVVDRLGIRSKLPEKPRVPHSYLGTITADVAARTGLSPDTIVGVGIHDSNSSLIPYLITQTDEFVLNSTGTWCVAMHPEGRVAFEDDEIGKLVFYNISFENKPVKTAILMGGLEYETYTQILTQLHGRDDDPGFDRSVYADVIANGDAFLLPSVIRGTGQFPDSRGRVIEKGSTIYVEEMPGRIPEIFSEYERAHALINISVAIQTQVALRRVGASPSSTIYVEGGFRNNPAYLKLLTALLPESPLALTAIDEATSFGAALCGKAMVEEVPVESFHDLVDLGITPVDPVTMPGIEEYAAEWLSMVETV